MNVIQCLQILLEETTEELETSLINTATRIRELDPDDERDHGLLWGFRDNIQAMNDLYTDSYFAAPNTEAVRLHAAAPAPVYNYLLTYRGSSSFSEFFAAGDPEAVKVRDPANISFLKNIRNTTKTDISRWIILYSIS